MSTLIGTTLSVLMIGSTHYIDIGLGKDAVIYYPTETTAHMRLPDKPVLHGSLELTQDGYHVSWTDGPAGNWQIAYEPGEFTYIGPDGKPAGTITRIVPGDAEALAEQ